MILGYAPDGVPFWVYGIGGVLIAEVSFFAVMLAMGGDNGAED